MACRTICADYAIRSTHVPVGRGAASTTRRTPSSRRASSTRWRMRPARTRTVPAQAAAARARSILAVLDAAAPRRQAGARRCRAMSGAASRSTKPTAASARKWSRRQSDATAHIRVHRVVSAIDPGHVVDPRVIEMQTQGAIVYRAHGRALWRDHDRGRPRGAEQFPRLSDVAHGRRCRGSRPCIVPSA